MSLADEENVQPLLSEQSVITGEPITQQEAAMSRRDQEAGPEQDPPESPTPGEIGVETGDVDPEGQPLPTEPAIEGTEIQRKANEADPAEKGPDDEDDEDK